MDVKKFLTEEQIEADRQRRQAEWERVRRPNDPIEAPADVFDNRSLYEKLKEQHDIKKRQFEDTYALKNQVRGIDTDEADFLDQIDRLRSQAEKAKRDEEKLELEEYKAIELEKKPNSQPISATIMPTKISITVAKKDKQASLISSVVVPKRKSTTEETETAQKKTKPDQKATTATSAKKPSAIVAILPGVGEYNSNSSSSSEYSSDEEEMVKSKEQISASTIATNTSSNAC